MTLKPAEQHLIAEAARSAPSADNSQPWRFHFDESAFSCHHRSVTASLFGAGDHANLIGAGAVAENIRQFLDLTNDILPDDLTTGNPYFHIPLEKQPRDGMHPLFLRHSNRFPFSRTPLPPSMSSALTALQAGSARLQVLADPDTRKQFSCIAKTCCQARFCNRDLHDWLMASLRWGNETPEADDGLDIETLCLPPGGRTLMRFIRPWRRMDLLNRWLCLYRLMADTEVQPLGAGPAIVCVIAENNATGSFLAGQLMQRVWILLNEHGWAVHPYYVVADHISRLENGQLPTAWIEPVSKALAALPGLLKLGNTERLHIALRVGQPTFNPPRSRRRLLSELTDHTS